MRARIATKALVCTIAFAIAQHAAVAQERRALADAAQLPPQITQAENVLVPLPSEIFETLDRFAHYNWVRVQRPELATWRPRGDQTSIALLLGAVIAEGFVAVAAKDAREVERLGRAVLTLSRGLGVQRWAIPRSRSIVEHAEKGDWAGVRDEWNHVLPDVQKGMQALRSEQLAHIVSLGGWARGAEALASLVAQKYSARDAELLHQPAVLAHFEAQLSSMSRERRAGGSFAARTGEHLRKVRSIFEASGGQISPGATKELASVAATLIRSATTEKRGR